MWDWHKLFFPVPFTTVFKFYLVFLIILHQHFQCSTHKKNNFFHCFPCSFDLNDWTDWNDWIESCLCWLIPVFQRSKEVEWLKHCNLLCVFIVLDTIYFYVHCTWYNLFFMLIVRKIHYLGILYMLSILYVHCTFNLFFILILRTIYF